MEDYGSMRYQEPGQEPGPGRTEPEGEGMTAAILAGVGAAAVGAVAWTVVVALTGYEIGWAAWAVGGLVGLGMASATPRRGPTVAAAGAGLALGGLVLARALIALSVLEGSVVGEITDDSELMAQATVIELQATGGFPEEIQAEYDAIPPGDTISDALWADMLAAAEAHLESLPDEERERIAVQFAGIAVGQNDLVTLMRSQITVYDALWVLLAVSTAWGMLQAKEEEEVTGAPA